MADTTDLKSVALNGRVGSTPSPGTKPPLKEVAQSFINDLNKLNEHSKFVCYGTPIGNSHAWLKNYFIKETETAKIPKNWRVMRLGREEQLKNGYASPINEACDVAQTNASKHYSENVLFFETAMQKPYGKILFTKGEIRIIQFERKVGTGRTQGQSNTVIVNEEILRDILQHSNQLHDSISMQAARAKERDDEMKACHEKGIEMLILEISRLTGRLEEMKRGEL